jgi:hypothetical protein
LRSIWPSAAKQARPRRQQAQEHSATAGFFVLCRKRMIGAYREINAGNRSPRARKTLDLA